jgi:hypothetical protein
MLVHLNPTPNKRGGFKNSKVNSVIFCLNGYLSLRILMVAKASRRAIDQRKHMILGWNFALAEHDPEGVTPLKESELVMDIEKNLIKQSHI